MSNSSDGPSMRWYEGNVTRYQWLVLFIASFGLGVRCFEGRSFVASMNDAMPQLLGASSTVDA